MAEREAFDEAPQCMVTEKGSAQEFQWILSKMNDGGASFEEIADYIDENL